MDSYNSTEKLFKVVCFGDSLTTCGGKDGRYSDWLSKMLPECAIINRGIGGDTIMRGKVRFANTVLQLNPDILIIELGANDYWWGKSSLNELHAAYEYMVSTAKAHNIEVIIASCFGYSYNPARKFCWVSSQIPLSERAAGIAAIENYLVQRYSCFYLPDLQVDIRPNGREPYWEEMDHPNKAGNKLVAERITTQILKATEKIKSENAYAVENAV
ncbi:MAG: SGNH/GDSL hydrolase family protein [Victivallaceae bacterium]